MAEQPVDRRIQRTRALLQSALVQLIFERGYDSITIQDITDRANLGRSTFYLHYQSKDDLLLDHHAQFTEHVSLDSQTRAQLLGDDPNPGLVEFLWRSQLGKDFYQALRQSRDSQFILKGIRQRFIDLLTRSLCDAFPDQAPDPPLDVLTEYIVGAQMALMDWWISTRNTYTAEDIAGNLHAMQRALIRSAYAVDN